MNTDKDRKSLVRGLSIVACLDEEVRTQRVGDIGRAHLSQVEAVLSAAKGPELLQAFRDWLASGMPRSNPLGGSIRVSDETSKRVVREVPLIDRWPPGHKDREDRK